MPSALCYASMQSDHSAIITPPHYTQPTLSTQTTISGFFDFGHIITEAVIVCGKRVKQCDMYLRQLSDKQQLTSITMNG